MTAESDRKVEYGVQIRDADHPRSGWRFRFGWYAEDEGGEERMRESLTWIRGTGEVFAARLIRRTVVTEVVDDEPVETPEESAAIVDQNLRLMGSVGLSTRPASTTCECGHGDECHDPALPGCAECRCRVLRPAIPDCTCSAGNGLPFPAQHATLCPRFAVGRTDLGGSDA